MSDIFHERDISPLRDTKDIDERGVAKKSLRELLFGDDKEEVDSKRFRMNTPTNFQIVPDEMEVEDAAQVVKLESTNAESAGEIDLDQENEEEPSPYLKPFQCEPDNNMSKPKIESHEVSVDLTPNLDPNFISCTNSGRRSASPSDSDFFTAGSTENINLSQPNSPTDDSTDTAPISISSDSNPYSVGSTDGTPLSNRNPLPGASTDASPEFTDAAPHSVSPSIPNPPSTGSPDTAPLSVSLYDNNTRSADFADTALPSASPEPNPRSSGSTDTASLSNNPSDFAFFFNSPPETVPNYAPSPYPNHFSADSFDRYNSPPDVYTRFADSPYPAALSASPPDLVHCCGSPSDDGGFSVSPAFSLCSSPPDSDPSSTSSIPPHPGLNASSAPLWIPENEPPLAQSSNVPYSITVASSENLMVDQHQREPNQAIGITPEDYIQPIIQNENNSGNHPYPGPNNSQGLENAENVAYASGLCASGHHQSPIVQIIPFAYLNSRRMQASPYNVRVPELTNWQTQRFVLGLLQAQRRFNRTRFRRMQPQQIPSNGRGQQSQQFRDQHLHARRIPGQQFHAQQFRGQQFLPEQFQPEQFQPEQFQPEQFQPEQFQAPQFQFYEFQVPLFQSQQFYAQQFQEQQQQAQQQYAQQQYFFQQQVQHAARSQLQTYPYYAQQWSGQQSQPPPYHAQQYSAEQSQAPLYHAQQYSAEQNQAPQYHAQQYSPGQVGAQQHQGSQPQRFFRSQRPSNNKYSHRILLPGVIQMPVRPANQNFIRIQRRGTNFREEPAPASFESIPVTANYPSNEQGDDIAGIEIACPNENHGLPLLEDGQYDDYPDNCSGVNVNGSNIY